MTKTYRFKKNLMWTLSMLSTFGPIIVFFLIGFINGEGKEKICLGLTMIAAITMAAVAALNKIHLRSTMYIVIIGLWVALDKLLPFLITIMISTILDELIFTPLYKRWNEDYHTNKQIDKRIES